MKQKPFTPSIIDFAYEIIDLHEENINLRRRVEHLEKLDKINMESIKRSRKHGDEMMGHLLCAIIDPNSVTNKGHEAIFKEQIENQNQEF